MKFSTFLVTWDFFLLLLLLIARNDTIINFSRESKLSRNLNNFWAQREIFRFIIFIALHQVFFSLASCSPHLLQLLTLFSEWKHLIASLLTKKQEKAIYCFANGIILFFHFTQSPKSTQLPSRYLFAFSFISATAAKRVAAKITRHMAKYLPWHFFAISHSLLSRGRAFFVSLATVINSLELFQHYKSPRCLHKLSSLPWTPIRPHFATNPESFRSKWIYASLFLFR